MSSINFEKFEELNAEYENIFENLQKKIKKLQKENEDLLNIVEEKNEIIKNREEKIDDFNNRVFYYSDFFGKSFDIAEERYQQENFFQLSMTLLKKIYISIQKYQYLLYLYLVLKKKILLKKYY